MGKIIRKKIEYAGGGGDGSGKIWSGTDGIDVDNNTSTISANSTLARTSQVPTKVSDLPNDAGYQDASEVDSKINSAVSSVFTYKGTVATTSALPNNASVGDVYNVDADGLNYAYDGTNWSPLAGTFDTSNLIENPTTKTAGQILEYNGTQWTAVDKKIKYWDSTYGSYPFVPSALINATDTRTPQQPVAANYMQVFHQMENGTCRALNISGKSEESGGYGNQMDYYERDTPSSPWIKRWSLDCDDTGWQTITGEYIDVKYRKKNGVVYMTFSGCYLKKDIPGSASGVTVTNCQLPNELVPTQHITVNVQGSVGAVGKGFMVVRPSATQGIQFRLTEPITVATNQSISMALSYPV